MKVLISGYLSEGKPSIGKYEINGTDVTEQWIDTLASPSFLCRAEKTLFAGVEHTGGGEIILYQEAGDGYIREESLPCIGGELCHLSYSASTGTIYGACYETGHVIAAEIDNGHFSGNMQQFREGGDAEPEGAGQTASRAHFCAPAPDGKYVYAVNIQQDRIYCYQSQAGKLAANKTFPYLQLPLGEGPRHLCYHPKLPKFYLVTEYSSRIFTLGYDAETGALTVDGVISALPEDYQGESYGSGIQISANGKWVYSGNRGANTIAVFTVDSHGGLNKTQDAFCGGNWPRHLALSKDGKYLLSANQYSNEVSILRISPAEGTLSEPVLSIPFANPSFVEDISEE